MCGRTACTLKPDDIVRACQFKGRQGNRLRPIWRDATEGQQYYPSYNMAPTAHTPVLLSSKHYPGDYEGICERVIQPMKWGLVPPWHKGDPYKMEYETNNCRAEGMLTKRTYKVPLEKGQRCVILADGFFEWKRGKEGKQPYFIYFPQKSESTKSSEDQTALIQKETEDMLPKSVSQASKPPAISEKTEGLIKTEKEDIIPQTSVKQEVSLSETQIKTEPCDNENKTEFTSLQSTVMEGSASLDSGRELSEKPDLSKVAGSNSPEQVKEKVEEEGKRLLTMAGVFEKWNPPDGSPPLYSYSVITVDASPAMSWIHDRMPAILTSDEEINDWLDFDEVPLNQVVKIIRPVDCLQMHMVSPEVNNSRNKSPKCVEPYEPKPVKPSASSNLMQNWLSSGKSSEKHSAPQAKKQKLN